jgi:hypothetical protein
MNMSIATRRFIYALWAIAFLAFAGSALGFDDASSEPLVPEGLTVQDAFEPGLGPPVGKVLLVEGEVLIIHTDMLRGYRAQKDLPLFGGDTIVTLQSGRIRFELNDGSTLTLIPETKLTISRSVYDPTKKSRASYVDMSVGKVRSVVTKLTDFKHSVFKVKTPTAVCGVRGSDFITFASINVSEITALEKTALDVLSSAFLEEPPLLITDFERAIVERGKRPRKEKISREKAEQMKREFLFPEDLFQPGRGEEPVEKPGQPGREPGELGREPGEVGRGEGILVPEYELVRPRPLQEPTGPAPREPFDMGPDPREDEEVAGVRDEAAEQRLDTILRVEPAPPPAPEPALAPFPATP